LSKEHLSMKKSLILAAAGIALAATTAFAIVSFDPATGTGWVGKGDVQTAFGWNNAAMQQRHTQITFEYDATTQYSWVCEWTTNEGKKGEQTHTQNLTRTVGVAGVIGNSDRRTGQWTGWFLTGFASGGAGSDGDFVPFCPGNPEGNGGSGEKVVVDGSLTETPLGAGLYAVYNGDRRPLQ
jgi:hypothetical protein